MLTWLYSAPTCTVLVEEIAIILYKLKSQRRRQSSKRLVYSSLSDRQKKKKMHPTYLE
jgi:hypothetical protein